MMSNLLFVRTVSLTWSSTILIVLLSVAELNAADSAGISPAVQRFMQTYCIDCHGEDQQNAALRFDKIPAMIGDQAIAQRWQDILDVLNLDQMPPAGAEQPSKEALSNVLETLTANLAEARSRLTDSGGRIVLRRLNRREYQQTIAAILGVPVDVTMLPEDGTVDRFDTLGQAHNFSSLHLERYLELGRRVLDEAIPSDRRRRKPRLYHYTNEPEMISEKIAEEIPRLEQKIQHYDREIAQGRKDAPERRAITRLEVDLSREYLACQETKTGCLIPFRGLNPWTHVQFNRGASPGQYRIRIRCGADAKQPVDGLYLKVVRGEFLSQIPDAIDYFQVTGTVANPQTIEMIVELDGEIHSNRFQLERRSLGAQRLPQYADIRDYIFKYPEIASLLEFPQPDIWIESAELEGPLPTPAAPLSDERLLGDRDVNDLADEDARGIIERFAYEAFRRRLPPKEYVERLMHIFTASREHGTEFVDALKETLVVILASPRFLYLYESRAEVESAAQATPLTDRELAVRLSYFLWSAPPDDELYTIAEQGKLRQPEVLAAQVDRMIASERSRLFVETFAAQWLELDRLGGIDPDASLNDAYDDAVQRGSREEVFATFNALLQGNLPVTNLIDSDFVVINSFMAQFYNLPGVDGDEFRKVKLPSDSVRGGLLGQSALLTLTGTGQRTSPVERGVFVLRKLLDRPPPPAPANVPMLDEETVGEVSIRQTLATHMTKAQCLSCHRRIDPLGFGLENFDPVGRWRTVTKSADGSTTFPIEPAGVMPDGQREFQNLNQMKQHLVADRQAMLTGLTKALMTYALGRSIGFSDQERVDCVVKETADEGYGLRTLVHKIVASEPFVSK